MSKIKWPKLPKAFKKKWVAALKSGDYEQGKADLCTIKESGTKYCCLGIAGKIVGHGDAKLKKYHYLNKGKKWKVPKVLQGYTDNALVNKLTTMNDGNDYTRVKPKSFKQIAKWIDKNL